MNLPNSAWSVQNAQAQGQRELLARFWIAAPTDMLEILWESPAGKATVALVQELKDDSQLMSTEISLRTEINEILSKGLQQPLATQLLLANFLFSPKDRLKIQNPEQNLPGWFVLAYKSIYESSDSNNIPVNQVNNQSKDSSQIDNLTDFPNTLDELISNRIQLNRMLGLSNLYYIDPEDKEIYDELVDVRRSFSKAIDRCNESNLENLWTNHLQDRYWSMVRCGIQNRDLLPEDDQIKKLAVQKLSPSMGGGFDKPGSINALLIAMLYFEPGTMTVNDPENNIPEWLKENFFEIFMQPISSAD